MLTFSVNRNIKVAIYAASVFLGLSILLFATFVSPGFTVHPEFDNLVVIAFIIALIPPSILDFIDRRWKRAIDESIPKFIRDIADSQKTGMAFTKAIEHSARLDYGPLTKELKQAVSLMSWGHPYTEALNEMAKKVNTPLVYRTITLLIEVGHSGGNLYEILENIYSHTREIQDMARDRRRQMTPYIMVIYASFGVYLFVVLILFVTFFAQIAEVVEEGAPFGSNINPEVYYVWFFHMSVIEAVIAGFIVGKMGEGAIAAGLKHILILLIMSISVFIIVILPSIS